MSEDVLTQDNASEDELVLEDSQLICVLTDDIKNAKGKENILQSVARMLNDGESKTSRLCIADPIRINSSITYIQTHYSPQL